MKNYLAAVGSGFLALTALVSGCYQRTSEQTDHYESGLSLVSISQDVGFSLTAHVDRKSISLLMDNASASKITGSPRPEGTTTKRTGKLKVALGTRGRKVRIDVRGHGDSLSGRGIYLKVTVGRVSLNIERDRNSGKMEKCFVLSQKSSPYDISWVLGVDESSEEDQFVAIDSIDISTDEIFDEDSSSKECLSIPVYD